MSINTDFKDWNYGAIGNLKSSRLLLEKSLRVYYEELAREDYHTLRVTAPTKPVSLHGLLQSDPRKLWGFSFDLTLSLWNMFLCFILNPKVLSTVQHLCGRRSS